MSLIILKFGVDKVKSFFPPVVVGPIIMVIGLRLSPVAMSMAGYSNGSFDSKSLIISGIVVISMVCISILKNLFPIGSYPNFGCYRIHCGNVFRLGRF